MTEAIGPGPEMYLKSLFELSPDGERVQVAAVAARLCVSPVSANEAVHRLAGRGLVDYRRYHGVRLTAAGAGVARGLIRRHRLWECFLEAELGLPWEAVHDLACELEHAAPDTVTEALAERLGDPRACPHGNPIPADQPRARADVDGFEEVTTLRDLGDGETGELVAVHPETRSALAALAREGLRPGATFVVERIGSDGVVLRLGRGWTSLPRDVVSRMHVRRAATSAARATPGSRR